MSLGLPGMPNSLVRLASANESCLNLLVVALIRVGSGYMVFRDVWFSVLEPAFPEMSIVWPSESDT